MSSQDYLHQRKEEIEVLESIFGELNFESDDHLILKTEAEDTTSSNPLSVNLKIKYTEKYPDELPEIQLESVQGELTEDERISTIEKLIQVGHESIGMAMIFSLSMSLQQELGQILANRAAKKIQLEKEEIEKSEQAEAARKKKTPINKETFLIWRSNFHKQNQIEKIKLEDEKLKLLSPKEREERKKSLHRLTGRQLFESNQALAVTDNNLFDADSEELDLTQFPKEEE